MLAVTIGVDGLPKIHHFLIALVSEHADLVKQSSKWDTALAATNVGYDTKRTKLVTTSHDRHPGSNTFTTHWSNVSIGLIAIKANGYQWFVLVFLG